MWMLFAKLLGWKYAVVYEVNDAFGKIRRIHTGTDGVRFFRKGIYGYSKLEHFQFTELN